MFFLFCAATLLLFYCSKILFIFTMFFVQNWLCPQEAWSYLGIFSISLLWLEGTLHHMNYSIISSNILIIVRKWVWSILVNTIKHPSIHTDEYRSATFGLKKKKKIMNWKHFLPTSKNSKFALFHRIELRILFH